MLMSACCLVLTPEFYVEREEEIIGMFADELAKVDVFAFSVSEPTFGKGYVSLDSGVAIPDHWSVIAIGEPDA